MQSRPRNKLLHLPRVSFFFLTALMDMNINNLVTQHPEVIWIALAIYLVSEGYTVEIFRTDVFKATRPDEDGRESTVSICKCAVDGWTFEYDWPYEICDEDPTPCDEGYVTDSGYADSASEAIGGVFAYLLGYAS